jgi:SAM-dependent methyltransferase
VKDRKVKGLKPERGGQEGRVSVLFGALLELGGVTPTASVLDIGCATGRIADRFANFLTEGSSFDGLDVRRGAIEKCRKRFGADHPSFRFQVADVFNTHYNPDGTAAGDEYRFPYEDGRFDFVYGLSLFTHMLPAQVSNYLRETARVLKPGGRCFFTYLLLNDHARAAISGGRVGADRLQHDRGDHLVRSEEVPEEQVAIDEEVVRTAYAEVGLSIAEVRYGHWTGHPGAISRQDIVVADKPSSSAKRFGSGRRSSASHGPQASSSPSG